MYRIERPLLKSVYVINSVYSGKYLIVTVLSKIEEPSVAAETPPAAAAAPPAAVAPVAVDAVLAFPFFFGRASTSNAESNKRRNDTTPIQDCGIIAMVEIDVQRQVKNVRINLNRD